MGKSMAFILRTVPVFVSQMLITIAPWPVVAETKFASGYHWEVTCAKLAPLPSKEDPLPKADHLDFGFTDTKEMHADLIVGPVESTGDEVLIRDFGRSSRTGIPLSASLSRVTGLLVVKDNSKTMEARYACDSRPRTTF
jgi:hypothetical protein